MCIEELALIVGRLSDWSWTWDTFICWPFKSRLKLILSNLLVFSSDMNKWFDIKNALPNKHIMGKIQVNISLIKILEKWNIVVPKPRFY